MGLLHPSRVRNDGRVVNGKWRMVNSFLALNLQPSTLNHYYDLRFFSLPVAPSPCLPVFSLVPVRENIVPRGVEEEDDLAGLDLDDVKLPVAVVVVLVR